MPAEQSDKFNVDSLVVQIAKEGQSDNKQNLESIPELD